MEQKQLEQKPKEWVLRFSVEHLKKTGYILIVVLLLGVIAFQQYYFTSDSGANKTKEITSAAVGPIEEETAEEEKTIEVEEETVEEDNTATEELDEELLPITGKISFEIDEVRHVVKSNDYARIMYVKFTIKNQKEDFFPTIKGYLEQYGDDDVKTADYTELKAGETLSKLEAKFQFGYNNINDTQTLVLDLYDQKEKLLKTAKKSGVFN